MVIVKAKIESGKIYIEQGEFFESTDTVKISEGAADSSGYVIIPDAGEPIYLTNTQVDTVASLSFLGEALDLLKEVCDTVVTTGSPAAPLVSPKVDALKAEIEDYKLL